MPPFTAAYVTTVDRPKRRTTIVIVGSRAEGGRSTRICVGAGLAMTEWEAGGERLASRSW